MRNTLSCSVLLPLAAVACASVPTVETPWISSSLDSNKGHVQSIVLKDQDPQAVVKRIALLAEKRDVMIVFSGCKGDSCDFLKKRKAETRSSANADGNVGEKWVSFTVPLLNASCGSGQGAVWSRWVWTRGGRDHQWHPDRATAPIAVA